MVDSLKTSKKSALNDGKPNAAVNPQQQQAQQANQVVLAPAQYAYASIQDYETKHSADLDDCKIDYDDLKFKDLIKKACQSFELEDIQLSANENKIIL